jgi:hypothetical protein
VKKKKRLFRGPSTNDTKKQDGPSRSGLLPIIATGCGFRVLGFVGALGVDLSINEPLFNKRPTLDNLVIIGATLSGKPVAAPTARATALLSQHSTDRGRDSPKRIPFASASYVEKNGALSATSHGGARHAPDRRGQNA